MESVIGFGAGLIAYAILGFFMDVKQMILAGLYIGTCSSTFIAFSDLKHFNRKNFFPKLPLCVIGVVIGVLMFSKFSSSILSIILGILLIALSIKIAFFDNIKFPKIFKHKLLLIGGISQGMFGMGGPFIVNALRGDFNNKSNLRTTMAMFFVFFNIIRFAQLGISKHLDYNLLKTIWWSIIPIFICIKLGHKVHLAISEDLFKKLIATITICSGIKFLIN
jgi:uncharacterized protein